jgi:BirA family biotin operon repressor/biotin-[acetyl-CoA-carboxylase] ligase
MNAAVNLSATAAVDDESEWKIGHHHRVESTQSLARMLPAWSAVWADEQTAGRGQAERSFVSDAGGVYLTAVLPYDGDALAAKGFALAVGWAVCTELRRAGAGTLRLRWPNDLMVGRAKVGGILVDQGGPGTLLVGVGLNITNRPWVSDTALRGVAGRLADSFEAAALPANEEWVSRLLWAIRLAHHEFGSRRLAGFVRVLNDCWEPNQVMLEPANGVTLAASCGWFLGIDASGAVRLRTGPGVEARVPAHHIHRLREVV